MRVLHLLDHSRPHISGYAMRSEGIVQFQYAAGIEPVVVTSPRHETDRYEPDNIVERFNGVEHHRIPKATCWGATLAVRREWIEVRQMENRIRELGHQHAVDIVHAHSPALNGLAALRAGRKLGIPVVYEVRALWEDAAVDQGRLSDGSVEYRLRRKLEQYVASRVDALCVLCEGLRSEFVSRGIQQSKIFVQPNGVDFDRFETDADTRGQWRREIRAQYQLGNDVVLGFIGSFYRFEGLSLLIQALGLLQDDFPSLRVLLVGAGEVETELRRQVEQMGLASRVLFAGRVPAERVPAYYEAMDILVYPRLSRRITELTTPLKPLEALAAGRPVLGSDVGGIAELLSPNEALLFRAGDVESLAAKLRFAITEPESLRRLLVEQRQRVYQQRRWDVIAQQYVQLYKQLLTT